MGKITKYDAIMIKGLREEKQWSSRRLIREFPQKAWSRTSLDRLLSKIDATGVTERRRGSGRRRSIRTAQNIATVADLICSQEDAPHSHKTPREIQRETGISRSSVCRIAKYDIQLRSFKRMSVQKLNDDCRIKRLQRCQQLLKRFPNNRSVRSVWFTDEKVFTVASPVNAQNDRVYSSATRKKDINVDSLVRPRQDFSKSVVVSVGVSRMGKTSVVFVEPGAKINSQYYCEKVLGQGLLPDIRTRCGRYKWTLQQDGAPSHTARSTVQYLQRENINFIEPNRWPPNSPDLNPVDYAVWGALQEMVYHRKTFTSVPELKRAIVTAWQQLSQAFLDRSIGEWRRRLENVVQSNGGHIEHVC